MPRPHPFHPFPFRSRPSPGSAQGCIAFRQWALIFGILEPLTVCSADCFTTVLGVCSVLSLGLPSWASPSLVSYPLPIESKLSDELTNSFSSFPSLNSSTLCAAKNERGASQTLLGPPRVWRPSRQPKLDGCWGFVHSHILVYVPNANVNISASTHLGPQHALLHDSMRGLERPS